MGTITIKNNYGTVNNICSNNVTVHNGQIVSTPQENQSVPAKKAEPVCEDIIPVQEEKPEHIDSFIFTKKAKKEGKEQAILLALKNSVQGRRDKTRAFVDELHSWQQEKDIDAHYNARVMFDELEKIMPLPFGYNSFRKYYCNLP